MFRVESTGKPQLTVDEVEKIKRKQVATIIGHVFQLTNAAFCEDLVNQRQRQHSCLMVDSEEAWRYYNDDAHEHIDLATEINTVENVCSTLRFIS